MTRADACPTPRRRSPQLRRAHARALSRTTPRWSASIRAAPGSPSASRAMLPGEHPVGFIDVSFYRDDYAHAGPASATVATHDAAVRRRRRAASCWSTTCSTPGARVRAAINELFDFGRPASDRARGAGRPRRPRAADRGDLRRRARRTSPRESSIVLSRDPDGRCRSASSRCAGALT